MFIGLQNSSRAIILWQLHVFVFCSLLFYDAMHMQKHTKIKIEQRIYTDPQLQQVYETGQIYTI